MTRIVTIGATALAFLGSLWLVFADVAYQGGARIAEFGEFSVTTGLRVGGTSALVAVAVTGVALAVQVYSVAYLHGDERYGPYAWQILLFTAAMLAVVFADDLILLLVGWEVMGICSYLLIGHDRKLPEAPGAAVKAFLVTRTGDVGFLLGIALLGVHAGTFRIDGVLGAHYSPAVLTGATLLLLAGVFGKSAQFPFHSWLPDAMAGPTPISALIHAATMVAAGVYVVARLYPLFAGSKTTLIVLGIAASVTMLLGACSAMAATDIKKVLAWSTVSQLGYMTGALAVGAVPAAMFHLLSHAAFKALLFLAAGAVIHAIGSNSLADAGGLRKKMPVTFWVSTIGLAALAGVPPFSGFWSKDLILAHANGEAGWLARVVSVAGLLTVVLTGWYATRLWLRTFFGFYRGAPKPHDPPALMRWPLLLLAVPAAAFGLYAALSPGVARRLGAPTGGLLHLDFITVLSLCGVLLGFMTAWRSGADADAARQLGPLRPVFANAFYFDRLQDAVIVRPVQALARFASRADLAVVDGAVEGTGTGAGRLSDSLRRLHAPGLPFYAVSAVVGVLIVALAAFATEVWK